MACQSCVAQLPPSPPPLDFDALRELRRVSLRIGRRSRNEMSAAGSTAESMTEAHIAGRVRGHIDGIQKAFPLAIARRITCFAVKELDSERHL